MGTCCSLVLHMGAADKEPLLAAVELIGAGSSGRVMSGVFDQQDVAIKTVKIDRPEVFREVEVLMALRGHARILRLFDFFVDDPEREIRIVTELLRGGDVLSAFSFPLKEKEARAVAAGALEGLAHVHGMGFMHRDIKPENLVLARCGDMTSVKLIDFGLARACRLTSAERRRAARSDGRAYTVCGTPEYVAPEVVQPPSGVPQYGTPADVWSMGITIFEMLSGRTPFLAEGGSLAQRSVTDEELAFEQKEWKHICGSAQASGRRKARRGLSRRRPGKLK